MSVSLCQAPATAGASTEAETAGRDLGIPVLGLAPWGTHFCQFYRTKQDLLDVLVPYFRAGVEHDEFCMWVTSRPLEVAEATEALRGVVPDLDRRMRDGQVEILSYRDWYLRDGAFDQDRVLSGWVDKHNAALARGYAGMRLTGNTFWLERDGWRGFTEYEAAVNDVIGAYKMIALCTYSLDRCGASEVIDVVVQHQFCLIKRDDQWTLIEPSERKRATETVELMNAALTLRTTELQAALADLAGFAHSVSHDLRAPLRAISSFGALLADCTQGQLSDQAQRLLDRIRDNTSRMDTLITDILSYSLAQRAELAASPLDMRALAAEAYDKLAGQETGRDVRVSIGELPPARGDRAMVGQVLANLLDNALKFTRDVPAARIEVGATGAGGETVYYVRDNGAGFDMAYAEKLFGVFQRLHPATEFEGTGLGLSICRQIITRHGGRIWAQSTPAGGTTVSFTLPPPEQNSHPGR